MSEDRRVLRADRHVKEAFLNWSIELNERGDQVLKQMEMLKFYILETVGESIRSGGQIPNTAAPRKEY